MRQPTTHELRREYALDQAMAEGRFVAASRAGWTARFDADPAGTERALAMLTPIPPAAFGTSVEQTATAGLTLMRGGVAATAGTQEPLRVEHPRPVTPAVEVNLSPEQVSSWTQELFRETRAGAGPRKGRITRDAA